MPLRDHFRPPVSKLGSWEGFHALWPGSMVWQLADKLPQKYVAEPRVRLGTYYEIDIGALERAEADDSEAVVSFGSETAGGGVAVAPAVQTPIAPTMTLDAEFPEQYAYEVLIFDLEQERKLVAAIELASPGNKDRPESRRLFAAKCFNLLQQNVCLSIVDLVTNRNFNLYANLLALIDRQDLSWGPKPPATYAVTCHRRDEEVQSKLDIWSRPLVVGETLPTLPLWLPDSLNIALDLETCYEETCRVLRLVK